MESFDVAVIGSGPGGYVAAIRAAQLGLKTVCIEKRDTFGGTCLNVGCIPSKALLESTGLLSFIQKHGTAMGIENSLVKANFSSMMERKKNIVKTITNGVQGLFKKNKVETIIGSAILASAHRIQIGDKSLEAKNIILATGSEPINLPFLPFDEKKILSSTGALQLTQVPKRLVVIGAGVIGVELGSVYARLGAEVQFVEMQNNICGALDQAIERLFLATLKKQGLNFHLGTKVLGAEIGSQVKVSLEGQDGSFTLESDAVLVAVGRRSCIKDLNLAAVGIEVSSKGTVVVDGSFRTKMPHIYAIGDLIDGPMLAHRASEEGVAVAEIISGLNPEMDYMTIPSVIYTHPEVAALGFTELEAKEKGLQVFTGTCSLNANARARCMDDSEGFVKVIGDQASRKLIGMHIIGPHASELIGEGVIAIKNRMTVEDLANTCHAHPSLAESIKEACLAALNRPINF